MPNTFLTHKNLLFLVAGLRERERERERERVELVRDAAYGLEGDDCGFKSVVMVVA